MNKNVHPQHLTHPAETARRWVVRLASGDMTERELQQFEGWIQSDATHRAAFERERALWQQLDSVRTAFNPDEAKAGYRRADASPRAHRLGQPNWMARAAALMVIAFSLWLLAEDPIADLRSDYRTEVGEIAEIRLPDGSTAHLNTDSALAVNYRQGERRVELLRGEIFFEVQPDQSAPFRVHAGSGITEAVGTAFVVRLSDNEQVTVSVTSGVVSVGSIGQDENLRLTVGQQTQYSNDRPPQHAYAIDVDSVGAWTHGQIIIDSLPLTEALAELDRYRKGRIIALGNTEKDRLVSGVFATDRIDSAVQGLAATQNASLTRLPGLMILR